MLHIVPGNLCFRLLRIVACELNHGTLRDVSGGR